MSQHGAQEVVEPPTDGVSNSICSRPVGGGGVTFPPVLWSLRESWTF